MLAVRDWFLILTFRKKVSIFCAHITASSCPEDMESGLSICSNGNLACVAWVPLGLSFWFLLCALLFLLCMQCLAQPSLHPLCVQQSEWWQDFELSWEAASNECWGDYWEVNTMPLSSHDSPVINWTLWIPPWVLFRLTLTLREKGGGHNHWCIASLELVFRVLIVWEDRQVTITCSEEIGS